MSFIINDVCFAQLTADAGSDTVFCADNSMEATIGGNPSAYGGLPPYTYAWSAEYKGVSRIYTASWMLEDTTVSNPTFKIGAIPDSVILYLAVKDANDSVAIDSVEVRLSSYVSCLAECRHYIKLGDSAKLWHCVFGGISPLTFCWTPTASLSDSTSETPWAKPLSNTTYELIITDSVGCQTRSICMVFVDPSMINSISDDLGTIQVYPIPARNEIIVVFDDIQFPNSIFEILTSVGEPVRKISVNDPMITIDVKDFLPGTYIYHWKSSSEIIIAGKFVIQ
jgi:hypothetical protein